MDSFFFNYEIISSILIVMTNFHSLIYFLFKCIFYEILSCVLFEKIKFKIIFILWCRFTLNFP